MKKILFVVLDGLGDRPIKELDGLTPLESADTPQLDLLASNAICGELYALGPGIRPSSDVAHMSLFGLDYQKDYTGRGPLELLGLGIHMNDGDIAWRGNFCTLDENGVILDRRIKRKTPSKSLLNALKRITVDDITYELHHYAEHRFALHAIGEGLSDSITDSDPHIENVFPLKIKPKVMEAASKHTAEITNKYIEIVKEICKDYRGQSSTEIDGILLRSAGKKPNWISFAKKYGIERSSCIANNALYAGVASSLGMKIANTYHYSNYLDYYDMIPQLTKQQLEENDFIFLHIAEGDLFGEDGDWQKKKTAIEYIDKALSFLNDSNMNENLIVVTADHSTPCYLKAHSGDSVPLLIAGAGVRTDHVRSFGERSCAGGLLGTVLGKNLMQMILNYCGKAPLIGG